MRKHELKTWPVYFEEIASGRLPFSVRDNEGRGFQKGDIAVLQEWDPDEGEFTLHAGPDSPAISSFKRVKGYTGRYMELEITYVESSWGVSPGKVVLAFGVNVVREVLLKEKT